MEIKCFVSPLLDENMYIICENGHCIIIDPYDCPESEQLLDGLRPDFMLVTHEHYDHISGVNAFKSRYKVPLYANNICNKNMQNPRKNFAKYEEAYLNFQKGVVIEQKKKIPLDEKYTCCADFIVEDGQTLEWMGHSIFIKMSPGHSAGSNLIILDAFHMFSGDCMLPPDIPAARFPGGNPQAFQEITLPYLESLDGNITVYPGHYDSFRLKDFHLLQREADFCGTQI